MLACKFISILQSYVSYKHVQKMATIQGSIQYAAVIKMHQTLIKKCTCSSTVYSSKLFLQNFWSSKSAYTSQAWFRCPSRVSIRTTVPMRIIRGIHSQRAIVKCFHQTFNVLFNSTLNYCVCVCVCMCIHTYTDCLCGLIVRVPGYSSRGPGSIPGSTRFSEK
jgi:hypothetical protein